MLSWVTADQAKNDPGSRSFVRQMIDRPSFFLSAGN